ncbi:MAG: hypothetical protein GY952_05315 [Rhodobacteraceae bacterium]|nr:hypothetical protein [Paracoccaceae bacterium]
MDTTGGYAETCSQGRQVAHSHQLHATKKARLEALCERLWQLKCELWQRFNALERAHMDCIDLVYDFGAHAPTTLPAAAVTTVLRQVLVEWHIYRQTALARIKHALELQAPEQRQRRLHWLATGQWPKDNYLHRKMRQYAPPLRQDEIQVRWDRTLLKVEATGYTTFERLGRNWLSIEDADSQSVSVPLSKVSAPITGPLQVLCAPGAMEIKVFYAPEVRGCGHNAAEGVSLQIHDTVDFTG